MGIHQVLITTFELLLTSGIGSALLVSLATKDLFLKEEPPASERHRFVSDYQELMWLAEKQRHRLTAQETRRFYQLRDNWPRMHA
jgi:hypothetical protein